MAGVFAVEEAVNHILYEENGDNQSTNDKIVEEKEDDIEERPVEKIERCFNRFEGCSGFDKDMFMSIGKNVLLPVVEMCESQKKSSQNCFRKHFCKHSLPSPTRSEVMAR